MSNPIFKFSHPDYPEQDLFFIYNLDSELSETLPLDFTTFIWYYLETKQSLEYLFTSWGNIIENSASITDTSFGKYFDEVHKLQFYMDAEFANSIELAKQNQTESIELKKLLSSKDNQNRINHFDFSFVHKDIKYYQGRHFIDLYFKSNFDKSIKDEHLISEQKIVLSLVKKSGLGLYFASELLKSDLEFIKEGLKFDFRAIYFADDSIKNNSEFLSEALKYDREFCLSTINKMQNEILQENQVEEDYDEYMQDEELTSETFSVYFDGIEKSTYFDYLQNHCSFDLSSWELDRPIAYHYLKDDAKYVLDLFNIWPSDLNFNLFELASNRLLNSKEFILQFFKSFEFNSALLFNWSKFPFYYWADREVVFEVIKKYGDTLEFVSQELKNDREIVFMAIKNSGLSFQYASENLRNDYEILSEVVKFNKYALKYASQELRNNRDVVLKAVKHNGYSLLFASDKLRNNREIILEAIRNTGFVLAFLSEEFKNDREIVLEAVKNYSGYALKFASEELRNDRLIALEAVKNTNSDLEFLSEELKNDSEIINEVQKNVYDFDLIVKAESFYEEYIRFLNEIEQE